MKQNDGKRLGKILTEDKEELREDCRQAAIADFEHVAKEYFELQGKLGLDCVSSSKGMIVTVRFHALRAKNFISLK